jgi:hypothetical protein
MLHPGSENDKPPLLIRASLYSDDYTALAILDELIYVGAMSYVITVFIIRLR